MLSVFQEGGLIELLARMEWHFLVAPPGNYFFTSDNPVCCWPPPGTSGIYRSVGPSHRGVEITFPLSRRVCAFAAWKPFSANEYAVASVQQVDAVNYRTIASGWHFLYGPNQHQRIVTEIQARLEAEKKRKSEA
jgi:hypothetical protein